MLIFLAITGYILVGVYSAFVNEPWWREYVERPVRPGHTYCHDCLRDYKPDKTMVSAVWVSGVLWPIFPFVKFSMNARTKIVEANREKVEREAERQKEMADAEAELKL